METAQNSRQTSRQNILCVYLSVCNLYGHMMNHKPRILWGPTGTILESDVGVRWPAPGARACNATGYIGANPPVDTGAEPWSGEADSFLGFMC